MRGLAPERQDISADGIELQTDLNWKNQVEAVENLANFRYIKLS
jgi:hypothetical protein